MGMECPAVITFLLIGIMGIQWSTVALSTGICIDRISSFIASACNGCIQITAPSQYSARTATAMNEKELLYSVAEECCYKKCSMSYLRSLCCNI